MFVILTYDVNAKRVSKVMKICRKYLHHVQKSVFEGHITEGKLNRLKKELTGKIEVQQDSIQIYRLNSEQAVRKEQLGSMSEFDSIIG